jgi:hypothetical protein
MAAKKRSKRKKQAEPAETRKQTAAGKNPCSGCDLDGTTCQVNGAKTLRRAACKTLKQNSDKISKSLLEKAETGDANSTKLLLMLSESRQSTEGAKKTKPGGKTAQELAEEPEWSEEEVETITKTGTRSREPED